MIKNKIILNEKSQYIILYLLQYINTIAFYLLIPRNIYIKDYKDIVHGLSLFNNMFGDIFIIVPITLGLLIACIRLILINLDKWYKPKNKEGRTPYGYINLATVLTMISSRNGTLIYLDSPDTYKNINILYLSIITIIFIVFFIKNYNYNFNKEGNTGD
jgi:hypothetical protein